MAELVAIGYLLEIALDCYKLYNLTKHGAKVVSAWKAKEKPKLINIIGIFLGISPVDPDFIPAGAIDAISEKMSELFVDNVDIKPETTADVAKAGVDLKNEEGKAGGIIKAFEILLQKEPSLLEDLTRAGVNTTELFAVFEDPERLEQYKNTLKDVLEIPIAQGINGLENLAFMQVIKGLSNEDEKDKENGYENEKKDDCNIGEAFFVSMSPFLVYASDLFSKIDQDNDQSISPTELIEFYSKQDPASLDHSDPDYVFKKLDLNGDGKIDKEEFISWQFLIYLRYKYDYCSKCKHLVEKGENTTSQCQKTEDGKHMVEKGTNYPCPGCEQSLKRHPVLPYSSCHVCHNPCDWVEDTCYHCIKCNYSTCVYCEDAAGKNRVVGRGALSPRPRSKNSGSLILKPDMINGDSNGINRLMYLDSVDRKEYFTSAYFPKDSQVVRSCDANLWALVPRQSKDHVYSHEKMQLVYFGDDKRCKYYRKKFYHSETIISSDHKGGVWLYSPYVPERTGGAIYHFQHHDRLHSHKPNYVGKVPSERGDRIFMAHDSNQGLLWCIRYEVAIGEAHVYTFDDRNYESFDYLSNTLKNYNCSQMKIARDEYSGVWILAEHQKHNNRNTTLLRLSWSGGARVKYEFGQGIAISQCSIAGLHKGCVVWCPDGPTNHKTLTFYNSTLKMTKLVPRNVRHGFPSTAKFSANHDRIWISNQDGQIFCYSPWNTVPPVVWHDPRPDLVDFVAYEPSPTNQSGNGFFAV